MFSLICPHPETKSYRKLYSLISFNCLKMHFKGFFQWRVISAKMLGFLPLLLIPGSSANLFFCKFDRQINFITVHTIPFPGLIFFSSGMHICPTLQYDRVRFPSCFFQLSGCGRPRMARRSLPDTRVLLSNSK